MNLESPSSGLFAFLFPWHQARLVEQVGGEVARECRADFWQGVCPRVVGMGVAEVRGYVRAIAEGFVVTEVDQVLDRRRLNPALRPRVVASAVDQLINLAVRDALSDVSPANAQTIGRLVRFPTHPSSRHERHPHCSGDSLGAGRLPECRAASPSAKQVKSRAGPPFFSTLACGSRIVRFPIGQIAKLPYIGRGI